MITLIDADIVAYRCASSVKEDEPVEIAIGRVNNLMNQILYETDAKTYFAFISGQSNFRKELSNDYKANRTQEPPIWLQACREHLVTSWKASVADQIEADDSIGIMATDLSREQTPFTIASLDKDLTQIPGNHYQWEFSGTSSGKHWVKPRQDFYVTPTEGLQRFYKQMLVGDPADNVQGVHLIGKIKAAKLIDHLDNELDMFDTVRKLYNDDERFLLTGKLLWILRKEGEIWQFPEERKEVNPSTEVN